MAKRRTRKGVRKKRKIRRTRAIIIRIVLLLAVIAVICLVIFGSVKAVKFLGGLLPAKEEAENTEDSSSNIITLEADGSIVETSVEDFDTSEYDRDELEKMVSETIESYNSGEDEKISLKSLDVKGGKARAVIEYKSAEDYAEYNGMVFQMGDAADLDITGVTLADDNNEVLTHDMVSKIKGKYVLLNADTTVSVPKKILYVSRNVTKTGKKSADVRKAGIDSVIIYK